jgi:hypothetical protein
MATNPTSPTPAPTQPRKSNLVWWVLGVVVAAVALLGLGGVLLALFFAREIEVVRTGPEAVEIRTPAGSIKAEKGGKPETGLPEYPGARVTELPAMVEITGPDEEGFEVTTAKYRTPDPAAQVDEWYRSKLGQEFVREEPGRMTRKQRLFGAEIRSDDIAYVHEQDELIRFVVIRSRRTESEIVLARLGRQELK